MGDRNCEQIREEIRKKLLDGGMPPIIVEEIFTLIEELLEEEIRLEMLEYGG